jgi:hypothetical protein
MKTNFLYFRELGSQTYTYSTGAQEFTLADAGGANFDEDIALDTDVKVVVTDISAGTDTVIPDNGKNISANVLTIEAASSNGFDLAAGDIVTITRIPVKGTEAMLSADRFLGVETDASATQTVISFKAMTSNAAGAGDDTITLTYPSETNMVTSKAIATALDAALNSNDNGGVISMFDRPNGSGLLSGLGITRLEIGLV